MFAAFACADLTPTFPVSPSASARHDWQPAGMDAERFICLTGRSGRRYMFCRISHERAALYSDCVFATQMGTDRNDWQLSATMPLGKRDCMPVFVHLPDETAVSVILDDLV